MMRSLIAASCLLAAGAQAQTHAIGRLFTTPQERHQLDVTRGLIAPPAPAPVQAVEPEVPPPAPVTVNGIVRRSGGPATVWINQQDSRAERVSGTRQAPRVTVTLPSGEQVRIKPGQTVDMSTGAVRDVAQ